MKNNKKIKTFGVLSILSQASLYSKSVQLIFFPKIEHTYRQTKRTKEKKPTAFV